MVTALASKPGVVSSNPAVGKKNFSFCKSSFRSLQLEEANANEINHDIHLANTLFQIKVRYKKYGCRLQWFITVHVSFNELSSMRRRFTILDIRKSIFLYQKATFYSL